MLAGPTVEGVVSAWAGSTNLGDELVLQALLAKLETRGVSPHVLSVDAAGTRRVHQVSAGSPVKLWRRASGASFVLFGGGGLVQDETSPFNLPYHLGRTFLLAGRSRPVAGIGLGAGPLDGPLGRQLSRLALHRMVAVSVRDAGSADVLRGLGVHATLAADLAVSLPTPQVQVQGRVAVSLRTWTGVRHALPVGLRRRSGRASLPPWFVPTMAGALDRVAASTGLAIHFVAFQADRDDAVHRAVADAMRTGATFSTPDVHAVVGEIAACTAVVAMRYHAGIAALLAGRPAVLIGYSPKVPSLALEVPGGMSGTSWEAESLMQLPRTLDLVLGGGDAVVEGRARLRAREGGNDAVIDRLLDTTGGVTA